MDHRPRSPRGNLKFSICNLQFAIARHLLALLAFVSWLALAATACAQPRPYIGYVYPAGGQQGTTFQIRLGGQGLDDGNAVLVTGAGVTAKVVEYYRRLSPQETRLLSEQLSALKKATSAVATAQSPKKTKPNAASMKPALSPLSHQVIGKIEQRTREHVATPACASIANLVFVEVTIRAEAEPGRRELRLTTLKGVSNPLPFYVGQVPEFSRQPMVTATIQTLGKEEQALRKRPADEIEARVTVPCTLNGQIASGEVNRYRFAARQGQRLVITTLARQLVPYIADAVPGWFQPVLALHDAQGKEVAFADDYRFNPDPVMRFDVPRSAEYVLTITDAIYRGREDFVYRLTVGELPFVTSIFPLGAKVGTAVPPTLNGWNLQDAKLSVLPTDAGAGIYVLTTTSKQRASNPVPFALDTLPEALEKETNNTVASAQKVTLPIIVNGRVDRPGDWDIVQFTGKSNDTVVAEVTARRLDSPLDAVIQLTDATGRVLAFNDDREDLGAGVNTHHADSWFLAKLPADGTYYVHLGDTARTGGDAYGYRLRLSAPRPDFALRAVPSSVVLRSKATATVTVYAQRKDGFTGPIRLVLTNAPPGFTAAPVTLAANQSTTRLTIKTTLAATDEPVDLSLVGSAKVGNRDLIRAVVPAEDRMQAFLWRHLVPASELKALVYDPNFQPPPKRLAQARPRSTVVAHLPATSNAPVAAATTTASKPKFTKQQVASRLRQLKLLFEEGLLTDEFYLEKVAECEAVP